MTSARGPAIRPAASAAIRGDAGVDVGGASGPTSVDEVASQVRRAVEPVAGVEHRPLAEAAGWTLARPLTSAEPLPPFDHSAVDGFAMGAAVPGAGLAVAGLVRAGERAGRVEPGEALRVMTGAPVSAGADRVAPQERCVHRAGRVHPPAGLGAGANIRRRGEDVRPGDPLMPAGTLLDARHVALLAATGHVEVPCVRRLRIALLATGDELCSGERPRAGRVRDSNTPMLQALLAAPDVSLSCERVPDDRALLGRRLRELVREADLVVTTGGMSFGEEDHVRAAVEDAGGAFVLRALAMKPGKPVGLARIGPAALLGLPGNPFAALVAFLVVGREALGRLRGRVVPDLLRPAAAGFNLDRRPGRTEYFPARVAGLDPMGRPMIERLGKGGSARLAPLVGADGLGRIEADATAIAVGDPLSFLDFRCGLRA